MARAAHRQRGRLEFVRHHAATTNVLGDHVDVPSRGVVDDLEELHAVHVVQLLPDRHLARDALPEQRTMKLRVSCFESEWATRATWGDNTIQARRK